MAPLKRIFGWKPSNHEQNDDAPPKRSEQSTLRIFTFQSHTTDQHAESSLGTCSPASSTCSHSPISASFDYHTEYVRRGDPSWVARPRNPFIIFRCEYSKEHAKEGKRIRRPAGTQTEKSISKRAAEAWHQLSPEERNRYKALANMEREEHARLHPNYRFRPNKRPVVQKRNPHPASSKLREEVSSSSADEMTAEVEPAPRLPTPPPMSPLPSTQSLEQTVVKAARRRSASVPVALPQPLLFSDFWNVERSRSASVGGSWMSTPSTPTASFGESPSETQDFFPRFHEYVSNSYSPHGFTPGTSLPDSEIVPSPIHRVFPLTAAASSLACWNGEPPVAPSPSMTSQWEPLPAIEAPLVQLPEFAGPVDGELFSMDGTYTPGIDSQWCSNGVPQYLDTATISQTNAGYDLASLPPSVSIADTAVAYNDTDRVHALLQYSLGLEERAGNGVIMPGVGQTNLNELYPMGNPDVFHRF